MSPSADLYIYFKGWNWTAPFVCFYCGVEVSPEQWAFSRSCGGCDVSNSHTARLPVTSYKLFAGPHDLADYSDPYFLEADRFLDPADREKYPVLDPPKTPWLPEEQAKYIAEPFPLPNPEEKR